MKQKLIYLMIVVALLVSGLLQPIAASAQETQVAVIYSSVPTEQEAYEKMIAKKSEYPEGMGWTNDNFYGWSGGIYSGGYGCVGFAFLLSDAAFGDLPARMLTTFSYSDLKVGDILRVNNDGHSVIILEIHEDYVVIAEGNFNSSIHWGRTLSKDAVMDADYMMTRYPYNAMEKAVVSGLKAKKAGNHGVSLTWSKVDGADGYIIYRKVGNGKFEYRYMVTGTSYTDNTASNDEYNFYRVYPYAMVNGERNLGLSGEYVYQKGGLNAVGNLKANPAGKNKVTLTWDKAEGAEGYIIYRKVGNGTFAYRYMVSGTSYTDTTASTSDYNFYRVYPYYTENNKRVLGPSTEYTYAKGILKAVTSLKAVTAGSNKVKLTWNKTEGAEGYIIYRKVGNGKFEYRYMVSGTTYTDTSASNSEYNFYRIYPYYTVNGNRILGDSGNYVYGKGRSK